MSDRQPRDSDGRWAPVGHQPVPHARVAHLRALASRDPLLDAAEAMGGRLATRRLRLDGSPPDLRAFCRTVAGEAETLLAEDHGDELDSSSGLPLVGASGTTAIPRRFVARMAASLGALRVCESARLRS